MPDYPITDPKTGRSFVISSESMTPPTPEDIQEIIAQLSARDQQPAEPYQEPMTEPTDPGRGVTGIAPEGVETWTAAQGVGLAGKGLERGAPYVTGPLGAGLGGKIGASVGAPFIGATLGAKLGHIAQPAVRATGRALQFAPQAAPWVAGAQLASEFDEEDGMDPLDVASLLGLGLTAFPPTSPLGLTLMTGSGLLGGAEQIKEGNVGAGLLEAGLSALPFAGRAYRGVKAMLPGASGAAVTSAAPAAAGTTVGGKISRPYARPTSNPGQTVPGIPAAAGQAASQATPMLSQVPLPLGAPSIKVASGGAAEQLAQGPGLKPTNDVVDMIRGLEPDFLAQDVVRWPRPAKGTGLLRTDESTIGLARELAQRQGLPVPTQLRSYPRPTGNTELERALRQRGHVAGSKTTTRRREPAKKGKK